MVLWAGSTGFHGAYGSYRQTYYDDSGAVVTGVEPGVMAGTYLFNDTVMMADWQSLGGPYYPSNGIQFEKTDGSTSPVRALDCCYRLRAVMR